MHPSKPRPPDFTSLLDKLDRVDMTAGQAAHGGEEINPSPAAPSSTPWKSWVSQLFGSLSRSIPFDAAWASAYQDAQAAYETQADNKDRSRAETRDAETRDEDPIQIEITGEDEQKWVLGELGLHPNLSIADLHRIRRDFAKRHHPDRYPPTDRATATRRMALANLLIDRHIKQKQD